MEVTKSSGSWYKNLSQQYFHTAAATYQNTASDSKNSIKQNFRFRN